MASACGPSSPAETTTDAPQTSSSGNVPTTVTGPTTSGGSDTTTVESTGTTAVGTTVGPTSATTAVTTTGEPGTTTSGTGTGSTTESVDSTTTGTSSSSTTSDTGVPAVCPAPVDCLPMFFHDVDHNVTDEESGWVRCNGGTVHYREAALDCAHPVFFPACDGQPGDCATDADCPGNESCRDLWGSCSCLDQCMSDSDCKDGEICACAGQAADGTWLVLKNECIPANCGGPGDCAGECGCRGTEFFCGMLDGAFCPTQSDDCHDNADCGGDRCAWEPQEQRWTCQGWGTCE